MFKGCLNVPSVGHTQTIEVSTSSCSRSGIILIVALIQGNHVKKKIIAAGLLKILIYTVIMQSLVGKNTKMT